MIVNLTRPIDFTTYGECLLHAVKDLGTSTPDQQTLRLMSWLFSLPISVVKQDCQEVWQRLRRSEQDRDLR